MFNLCLLFCSYLYAGPNKLHLFSLTQHRFILIQIVNLYMYVTYFGLYLGLPQAYQ